MRSVPSACCMEGEATLQKHNGALWNALGSAMYGVNSFVMLAAVSRGGTVEQAGHFGIAFTTAQILYIVGLFAIPHYQMTDYGEKFGFSTYAKGCVFSCALMLLGCCGAIFALGFSPIKQIYTLALTLLMLLNVVGELYQSLFFQKNRLDLSGSALFYRTLFPLLLFCSVIFFTRNILAAIVVQTAANLFITLYYALHVAPPFIKKPSAAKNGSGSVTILMRECFPLFISVLLMNLLLNLSKYGIEFLLDDAEQGYFGMIFLPTQVINLCSQFLFKPYLNHYSLLLCQKNKKAFFRLLRKQLLVIAGFTIVCGIAAFLLGAQVLGFIFAKDLSSLVLPLTLLVFGGGVFAACQLFYFILVILRKQKSILGIYAAVMALSAGLTIRMISRSGILGAVFAFVATHGAILLGYLFMLRRSLRGMEISVGEDCVEE